VADSDPNLQMMHRPRDMLVIAMTLVRQLLVGERPAASEPT
jgi:hypothetical protein